jgi:hypothetical protein
MRFKPTTSTPAPVGNHPGRCVRVIELGTQTDEYKGESYTRPKVILSFELPTKLIESGPRKGEPYMVSKWATNSLNENSALYKMLVTWRGSLTLEELKDGFEAEQLLGEPCLVNIAHSENGKAKITNVTRVPEGMTVPPQVNESVLFSLDPDLFDPEVFEGLPETYKNKIVESPEYRRTEESLAAKQAEPADPDGELEDDSDDIPC